ncbi:MAG TPA: CheR family methyltransferase [Acidimicrobiales bacterium]|nr:CheR family methyltransferase [Acidimicrobiales bacterium]
MSEADDRVDPELDPLLQHVKETRGFDFTGYKRSSLTRRIRKRMDGLHIGGFADYRAYLDEHPDEFVDLFNTILINVTSFFRDPETWTLVAAQTIPRILEARAEHEPVRAWVAGCASGEEPYTIAILLCEAMGDEAFRQRVKIYATDVDEAALTEARHGRYPTRAIAEDLSPDLLERYFDRDGAYSVFRKDLRRSVIFGRHDLVQDPPITRIDLLSCRNTLMYFTPAAQTHILKHLHFALRPTGFLVLGRSEALVTRTGLFTPVDLKGRVFRRQVSDRDRVMANEGPRPTAAGPARRVADVRSHAFELGPVAQVLLDTAGTVVAANQHARAQFGLSTREIGRPVQDLELSYRPLELRSRLETVYSDRHALSVRGVEWRQADESVFFDVVFQPVVSETGTLEGTSVSFIDVTPQRRIQKELDRAKSDLETAYEELQSAVEELETTNEELQSTNEELETTNEELQSTNEELETINDELRQRTVELNEVNGFLEAILTSLNSAVIVVDRDVRIRVWNRHAHDLWGLRAEEVEGQHLMNLDIGLPLGLLRQPMRSVLVGDEADADLAVDAVNRRGRSIRCRVRVAPLRGGDDAALVSGVILLMDADDGVAGPGVPDGQLITSEAAGGDGEAAGGDGEDVTDATT